jgi:cytochrome c biogenesis protein CcmG/thiol:disulfide interchange protein DsbE
MFSSTKMPLLIVLVALPGFLSCVQDATMGDSVMQAASEVEERKPAPDFTLKDAAGRGVTLSDYRGKVVLLNFWATWCGPCKIEMPWFVAFQRKYKDQGFTVLAISLDEGGWDPVRTFAEAMEFNFPVALGGDPVSEDFGGIYVLPTTLIVDRSGKIVFRHSGLIPKAKYETEIESLL